MQLRLKELRQEKNINQNDFSSIIGVSKSSVCLYEQGQRVPDIKVLLRMAEYFGVSLDYLLGRTDTRESFSIENVSRQISQYLMKKQALMFSAEKLTPNAIKKLSSVIQDAIKNVLTEEEEKRGEYRSTSSPADKTE